MIKSFWNEEWKEIKFEEGALQKKYAISNYGRIVSYLTTPEEGTLIKGGKLRGYATLPVRPHGKSKTFYVHKLVAQYFIDNDRPDATFVIHLDHNKNNNYTENLKWCTKEEVFEHQKDNPIVIEARKKQKGRRKDEGHKLTSTEVIRLKKKIFDPKRKSRLKIIAKQFGISEMQLYRIKSGENWGHIKVEINGVEY